MVEATSTELQGGKPQEIELWSNRRLIHPLSRRLAEALRSTPVTPNAVSCMGVGASAAAAACYWGLSWPASVAAGFLCQIAWHVLDGADGELARRTGRSSPSGEVVDGVCDYLGQFVLYSALVLILARSLHGWAWALGLASGLARVLQANSYESRRRNYQYWACGRGWLKQSLGAGSRAAPRGWMAALAAAYLALSERVAGSCAELDAALSERLRQGADVERRTRLLYRRIQAPAVNAAAPLSANARTIAIGVSMLAGTPLYFFVYESVGLSLFLLWSLRLQAQADRALLAALGASHEPPE
ncbi:CDP-alcohol phosphatidyltransferase family protein [Phenylobacterium sp.]|jgi:hypothetical protein|uniref:CDP-alcohol phosphatidyltransferase family protein n=1 Tax=Phenylobacterium sp. TaxID=1871053 RepID=UPI002F407F8D